MSERVMVQFIQGAVFAQQMGVSCRNLPMGDMLERMRLEKTFRHPSPAAFARYASGRARMWWMGIAGVAGLSALIAQAALGFDTFHVEVPVLAVLVAGGVSLVGFLTSRYATFSQSALKLATDWQARVRKAHGEALAAIEDRGGADATRADRKSVEDALFDAEAQARHIRAGDFDMVVAYNGTGQAFVEFIQMVAPLVDNRFPNCVALYELWRSEERSTSFDTLKENVRKAWEGQLSAQGENTSSPTKAIAAPEQTVEIDVTSVALKAASEVERPS